MLFDTDMRRKTDGSCGRYPKPELGAPVHGQAADVAIVEVDLAVFAGG